MRNRTPKLPCVILLAFAVGVGVGGCGDDDSGDSADSDAGTDTATGTDTDTSATTSTGTSTDTSTQTDADTSTDTGTSTDAGTATDTSTDTGTGTGVCGVWTSDWSPDWSSLEEQLVELINEQREAGADCGAQGTFEPAPTLTMEPHLRCAARVHSLHMGQEDYFDHNSPGGPLGDTAGERVENAGYAGTFVDEDLACGQSTAEELIANFMGSDMDCANMMDPAANEVGVGYANVPESSFTHYWTVVTGAG